ncbi:MAG TPA: FAD-binding oxidoreductase [Thermohalobaculum sp.]|nr:FAD-binding oxidoreductase [Thermohalobaculum sp.]
MRGPLDAAMYRADRPVESWWRASAPPWREPAPLAADSEAEVAIIGGGYAGLACAIRLAELGIGSAVLEAGEIGWGASGRNGGIVGIRSDKLSDNAMIRRYGEDEFARYVRAAVAGNHRLRAFCTEAGLGDAVQGDGEFWLAHSARVAIRLEAERSEHGVGVDVVPPEKVAGIRRHGGLMFRPGFGIQPLRLVRALADRAAALGVQVFPRSEVTRWERDGARHRLVTAGGAVAAARVVLATNGFTPDGLDPRLGGRAIPVISNIGVTRVLTGEERASLAWLGDRPGADARHLLSYFRLLPEGRFLIGMRGDLRGSEAGAARMRRALAARMARQFPALAGVEFTHFWRGPICATARLTPSVGLLPGDAGIGYAFGWHGSGINGAQVGGRLLAEVLAGEPESHIPAPLGGLAPRLPFPGLRPCYVGAMQGLFALRDALSAF